MGCPKLGVCSWIMIFLSSLLGFSGFIMLVFHDKAIHVAQKHMLPYNPMKPSEIYKAWLNTKLENISIYQKFYIFNVTNPDDVVFKHAKPNLKSIGPFVFQETVKNTPGNKFPDPSKIEYYTEDILKFDPEQSVDDSGKKLKLDDFYTISNEPLLSGFYRTNKLFGALNYSNVKEQIQMSCGLILENSHNVSIGNFSMFKRVSVRQLLFGFTDDQILLMGYGASLFNTKKSYSAPTTFHLLFNTSLVAPSKHSDRWGQKCPIWNITQCNTTTNAVSGMYTGMESKEEQKSLDNIAQLYEWAGQKTMWWWGNENKGKCQKFQGTMGTQFKPGLNLHDFIHVFVPNIYRSIQFEGIKKLIFKGIKVLQFRQTTEIPGNETKCYGTKYRGIMSLEKPLFVPLYVTNPFFYDVDLDAKQDNGDKLIDVTFEGKSVKDYLASQNAESEYTTTLNVEPITGLTVHGIGQLQISGLFHHLSVDSCKTIYPAGEIVSDKNFVKSNYPKKFPSSLLPLLYVKRVAGMNSKQIDKLRLITKAASSIKTIGIILTIVALIINIFIAYRYYKQKRDSSDYQLVNENNLNYYSTN